MWVHYIPIHPIINVLMSLCIKLFLWNLNEDIEGPVARMNIAQEGFLKKIAWAENGMNFLHVFLKLFLVILS